MKGNKYLSYLFEIAWILPSIAIPAAMLVAIALTAFAMGVRVPSAAGRVDPKTLTQTAPFDQPGLRELAPGRYEAVLIAQTFLFEPKEIRVPQGAEVTFVISSKDVIHGLKIENTPINVMVVPGQVSRLTTTFRDIVARAITSWRAKSSSSRRRLRRTRRNGCDG
jgi:cytochrome c oxidase subunit II